MFLVLSQCSLFASPLFMCACLVLLHSTLQQCTGEHLHTHKGAWKDSRKIRSPSSWATPRPLQASPAHQELSGIHRDRWEHKPTTPKNNQLVQTSMSVISAETSASVFRHENHHRVSREQFWKTSFMLRGVTALR